VWAPADRIAAIRADLELDRSTDAYAKRHTPDTARRARKQNEYVEDFRGAVLAFLDFAPHHANLAERVANAVTQHATPVGSGTVARSRRVALEQRAESAVIAWLRHQMTAYENMKIPRTKGKRREVRRMLAGQSRRLLAQYRVGKPVGAACPLRLALSKEFPATPR
jgi:hypothetical protein